MKIYNLLNNYNNKTHHKKNQQKLKQYLKMKIISRYTLKKKVSYFIIYHTSINNNLQINNYFLM